MSEYTKIQHQGTIYYIRKEWVPPEPRTTLDLMQSSDFVVHDGKLTKCRYGIELALDTYLNIKE